VAFDQAGDKRLAGQVDGCGAGRHRDVGADGGDAFAFDQHLPAGMRGGINTVEHLRRAQEGALRFSGACGKGQCERSGGRKQSFHGRRSRLEFRSG
jgi:hypothetical protein